MSPLIDLTNTIAPDIPKDVKVSLKSSPANELEPKNVKDLISVPSKDSFCQESTTTKDASAVTKCNKLKASYHKRKRLSSRIPSINEDKSSVLMQKPEQLSHRVPLLPSDHLSQAFAALHLGREKIEVSNLASKTGCNFPKGNRNLDAVCKCRLTGFSNTVRPPGNSFASTYQCVACSLEFSSLENLTCHLVKHIYEGLHAASWLNNAMSILVSSSVSEPTATNVRSSETSEAQAGHFFSESVVDTKLNTGTNNSNS